MINIAGRGKGDMSATVAVVGGVIAEMVARL